MFSLVSITLLSHITLKKGLRSTTKFPDLPRYIILKLKENSLSGTFVRLGWFLFLYSIGKYLFLFLEEFTLFTTLELLLNKPLLWFIDKASVSFLGLFYHKLSSSPDYLIRIDNVEVIQLFSACSGLNPMLRMTFILIFYPIPWKIKLWLYPLSMAIILFAAIIHFIMLVPIANHWPKYYAFIHNWFSRVPYYGFYFLTWLIWEKAGFPKIKLMHDS